MRALYDSIQRRQRPEDVADRILELCGDRFTAKQRAVLERAARGSLRRSVHGYTSMLQDFARPVGLRIQVEKARRHFETAYALTDEEASDPAMVEAWLRHVSPEIRKVFGASDFKHDRLTKAERKAVGLEHSRRRYNRAFRRLRRMEAKLGNLVANWRKYEYTRIGKSALATRLSFEDFAESESSACFIAYYVARCNLRSEFTVAGQQRPFDEIAEMLLARCFADASASFYAIAHVLPRHDVIARLEDEQKMGLLTTWYGLLRDIAELLRQVWDRSRFNRQTMIVRRGDDSSTWNQTASAFNQARQHWFALLYALGMDGLLDELCPGKVLRLMAADVAYWHRAVGGSLDPDTEVWAELPPPWDVLDGAARSARAHVEAVCRRHGIDPVQKGWTAARPPGRVAKFRPTPELVHGVTVAEPHLAAALRRAGWFSGKHVKATTDAPPASVHPLVIGAHRAAKEQERAEKLGESDA